MMTAEGMTTTHSPSRAAVSVQRTYRSSPARTWLLLASRAGAAAWLGDVPNEWWQGDHGGPQLGDVIETPGGERYEVCAAEPGARIQLRTLGPGRAESHIEISVTPERGRTVLELRQEPADPQLPEQLDEQWSRALDRIGDLLDEA